MIKSPPRLTSESFAAVVKALGYNSPNPKKQCPDQWVGMATWAAGGFNYQGDKLADFCRQDIGDIGRELPPKRVVIVLESPHIDEFRSDGVPLGPAKGTTGRNIRSFLDVATRGCGEFQGGEGYALILINAIPFQCSLGLKPGKSKIDRTDAKIVRDRVFRKCWEIGRDDFCSRLKATVSPKTLVINACTMGVEEAKNGHPELRKLVEEAIVEVVGNEIVHIRRCHPSSYHWCSGKSWSMAG